MQPFPGSERAPTLAEVQEMQKRLTAAGFDTGGTDGRVGNMTMAAARGFQQKAGLVPADGYLGLKLLAKLRGWLAPLRVRKLPDSFAGAAPHCNAARPIQILRRTDAL